MPHPLSTLLLTYQQGRGEPTMSAGVGVVPTPTPQLTGAAAGPSHTGRSSLCTRTSGGQVSPTSPAKGIYSGGKGEERMLLPVFGPSRALRWGPTAAPLPRVVRHHKHKPWPGFPAGPGSTVQGQQLHPITTGEVRGSPQLGHVVAAQGSLHQSFGKTRHSSWKGDPHPQP